MPRIGSLHAVGMDICGEKSDARFVHGQKKNIRSAFPADKSDDTGYVEGADDDSTHESELERAWKDFLNS